MSLRESLAYSLLGNEEPLKPVAIIGAGTVGAKLADELRERMDLGCRPVCFIDMDGTAAKRKVAGLRVYDPDDDEKAIRRHRVRTVILALPEMGGTELARLYHRYTALACKVLVYENAGKREGEAGRVRPFSIEDLLTGHGDGRDDEALRNYYRYKRVLIIGGGGNIGSILCHALAPYQPERLVILDVSENGAYALRRELLQTYGKELPFTAEICSTRDRACLQSVFLRHKPQIVFFAASHRRVGLMEQNGEEVVKNNVVGVRNAMDFAEACNVERFLFLSSCKAVRPVSLVGATNRLSELMVAARSDSRTGFAAVRFGNVLDGKGGILERFHRQIAAGGPVLVKDKSLSRQFLTREEISHLLLRCARMARQGEILVVDGDRTIILYDLAESMIRIAGKSPGKDLAIRQTGLDRGDKIREELCQDPHHLTGTDDPRIFIEHSPIVSAGVVDTRLKMLSEALGKGYDLRDVMQKILPEYRRPADLHRKK